MSDTKESKAKRKPVSKRPITAKFREELDAIARKAAGKDAIVRRIKMCHTPKFHRYEFLATENGHVINLNIDGLAAHVMPESSSTVKNWRKAQARREKKAEAKLAAKDAK